MCNVNNKILYQESLKRFAEANEPYLKTSFTSTNVKLRLRFDIHLTFT